MVQPLKKTPLNKVHHDLSTKTVHFTGQESLGRYTFILDEHSDALSQGYFDISDMGCSLQIANRDLS